MKDHVKRFLTISFWVVIIVFVIILRIVTPISAKDYFGCAGQAITVSGIIMTLYSLYLWRYNPLEKVPKLAKNYLGDIQYDNGKATKKISIIVQQNLFNVSIRALTDESKSNSVNGSWIFENGEYVLYYTYLTNPKAKTSDKNPMKYGTCRLALDDNNNLDGSYWTSNGKIGDIYLKENQNDDN